MRSLSIALGLLLAATTGMPAAGMAQAAATKAPAATATTPPAAATTAPAHAPRDTRCGACHVPSGWGDVRFVHERTGFPLTGLHAQVACRKCHPGDFKDPLPRSCAGCHRDVHAGNAGVHCAACHDTAGWQSRFDADAHRRTNFPLQGRHALIPCEQCHGDRRDRSFARPTVPCWECHQADLQAASGKGLNHAQFPGYPELACLGCHGFWRWSPATFSGHGACFPIDSGHHAGIPCLKCHVTLPVPLAIGSCSSQPYPNCISCHPCAKHPPQPPGVVVCDNRNCYGCHYNGQTNDTPRMRTPSPRGTIRPGGTPVPGGRP